jgi:hyperosmotically inducible protein
MRRIVSVMLIALTAITIGVASCKSKPKDADIKMAVEKVLAADPMASRITVSVDKGIATLTGECSDELCKTKCAELVSKVKGVKNVVNNSTIAVPVVPVVTDAGADVLSNAVTDALKDFPGVTGVVRNQVLTLTGEITKDKLQKLIMT